MKTQKMKNITRRLVAFLLVVVISLPSFQIDVKADEYWPDPGSFDSQCIALYEIGSGTMLYEQNADMQSYPASITKILTTLLVIENCDFDEIVTFSKEAVDKNEGDTSHIFRDYDEQMTVEQCVYAVMLFSANECAYALAEHVAAKKGGNIDTFVDMMNARVKKLGCTNTHFNNPHGLPDENHYTTAKDMALIAAEAYKNETFRVVASTKTYNIPPTNKHSESTYMYNHHNVLYPSKYTKYVRDWCTGGKTGYTDIAGSTLVTFGEKNGMKLVCVILRSRAVPVLQDSVSVMEFGFANFQAVSIADRVSEETAESTKSMGFLNSNEAFASLDKSASIVIPATASIEEVTESITSEDMEKGTVAELEFKYAGRRVGSAQIVANASAVPDSGFEEKELVDPEIKKVVKIKPRWIVEIVLLFFIIAMAIFFGKKLVDNFYWLRHQREVKRERRKRLNGSGVKKRKKRRKKDIMFK